MKRNFNSIKIFKIMILVFCFAFLFTGCGSGGGNGDGNKPPAEPQNVRGTAGIEQVIVSWDSVNEATSYRIYWNETGNVTTSDTQISGIVPPYTHTGLTPGMTYYYIVTAVNDFGESSPSSEISAIPFNFIEVDVVSVGSLPIRMALNPTGERLYVVNCGVESPTNQGSISVIDTESNTVVNNIQLGIGFPISIAITPDGAYAYLAISKAASSTVTTGSNRVEVINLFNNLIVATIPIIGGSDFGPTDVAITPDGTNVYVTNRGSYRVDVISTANNSVLASIPLGSGVLPMGIAITPDGSRVYVGNRGVSTVSIISTATKSIVGTVSVSIGPSPSQAEVTIDSEGRYAYVTNSNSGEIAVLDIDPTSPSFNKQIDVILTNSNNLAQIGLVPGDAYAFVVSSNSNEMLIIDLDSISLNFRTQVASIQVGNVPFGLVIQNLPQIRAYVSNRADGTISVIGNF